MMNEELRPAYVGTFHSFMSQCICNNESAGLLEHAGDNSSFYREDMPIMAIEALEKYPQSFDKIIIDEAVSSQVNCTYFRHKVHSFK